jgi:antitoxin component of RelBE/YafQ-DinJ toxin-antitoxin module
MPGTTSKGFRFPTAGDNPAVHTDILNLATDIDTALDGFLTGVIGSGGIAFEGSTLDANETTLNVIDPTNDRTINLPDASGTVALTSDITNTEHFARTSVLMLGGM